MHRSVTFNKKHQEGLTLVEVLITILILGVLLGTAIMQVLNLFKTNQGNSSVLNLNTITANELEKVKDHWSQGTNWESGEYIPSTYLVDFTCANWNDLNTVPTVFTDTCSGGTYLKRVRLIAESEAGNTLTVYVDLVRPRK